MAFAIHADSSKGSQSGKAKVVEGDAEGKESSGHSMPNSEDLDAARLIEIDSSTSSSRSSSISSLEVPFVRPPNAVVAQESKAPASEAQEQGKSAEDSCLVGCLEDDLQDCAVVRTAAEENLQESPNAVDYAAAMCFSSTREANTEAAVMLANLTCLDADRGNENDASYTAKSHDTVCLDAVTKDTPDAGMVVISCTNENGEMTEPAAAAATNQHRCLVGRIFMKLVRKLKNSVRTIGEKLGNRPDNAVPTSERGTQYTVSSSEDG
jgi:hypothetical protein